MPEDDVPPEEIWHHPTRLEEWFEAIKARRDAENSGMEQIPEEGMTQNELVADMM